ncbi:MAG: hypothetical protein ACTSUV_06815 [Candidatus Ranarchaeia archaeon]
MLKNVPRELVLKVVKQRGPTIPARIVKELGGDTFLIGAILSDLLNNKLLRVSNLKLGGSPFYFAPEHASRLQEFSKHLKNQDKTTYDLLKASKVLKDEQQTPLIRVSLRNIKDFAKPVEVKIGETQELFWKFYLIPNEEVKQIIKDKFLKRPKPAPVPEKKPVKKEINPEPPKVVEKTKKIEPKPQVTEPPKKPVSKPVTSVKKEEQKSKDFPSSAREQLKEEKQVSILQEDPKGSFGDTLSKYFNRKNIEVVEKNIIRKTEIDYVIRVPSSIGTMEYYCKAKDKKKCNDGDIATAFIQGQNKKLPVLFLTTGDVTKKVNDMLHKEFKGLTVNKI